MNKKLFRENPPEEFDVVEESSIYPAVVVFLCILLGFLMLVAVLIREIIL